MPKDIFISYSRSDRDRVYEIVSALERDGFSVWIDREGIDGGSNFVERIVSALQGCEVVVFFSSAASNASPWTKQEISLARENNRTIIPVRLDMTPYIPTAAFFLSGVHYIDMTDSAKTEKAIADLEKSLRVYVGTTSEPDSPQKEPADIGLPYGWEDFRRFDTGHNEYGYADVFGETVIDPFYEDADIRFEAGYARVKKDGKWGCIDACGKVVVPIAFKTPPLILGDDAFAVSRGDHWGIRTKNGHFIAPCDYDAVGVLAPRVYLLQRDSSFYICDRVGTISKRAFWSINRFSRPLVRFGQMLVGMESDVSAYISPDGDIDGLNRCGVIFLDDPMSIHPIEETRMGPSGRVFACANGRWGELEVAEVAEVAKRVKGESSFLPFGNFVLRLLFSRKAFPLAGIGRHLDSPTIQVPFAYSSIAALRREKG